MNLPRGQTAMRHELNAIFTAEDTLALYADSASSCRKSGQAMNRVPQAVGVAQGVTRPRRSLSVIRGPCSQNLCVLYLDGPLLAPLTGELRHRVHTLLRRGERAIALDLTSVPKIDAAGVGQLVRAYNVATAAKGTLRIMNASAWVRHVLERVCSLHFAQR
jgi:anti-anti-sigma regulatory factor